MTDDYLYPDAAHQDILRMIPPDGKLIGSIGCGTAAVEQAVQRQGREVHGVDVHRPAIDIAKTRIASARVVGPDDKNLFAPASLDGLILADVIEHLPAARERLIEFAGYVRPGGWVVISVPNMRSLWGVREFILRGDWPEDELGIFDRTHLQVMTERRLRRWCGDAGLAFETLFDRFPQTTPTRLRVMKAIDAVTFGRLRSWMMVQVQVRCRKKD